MNNKKIKEIRRIAKEYGLDRSQYRTLKMLVLQAEEGKAPMSRAEMVYVLKFVGETFK